MRWSSAAKTPSRNCRASVGWRTGSSANGLCESISALVSSLNDGQVQTTCAEGRRGDVDDLMRGRIQLARRSAHGDGLADTHLASNDAEQGLANTETNTRDGFLMAGAIAEL